MQNKHITINIRYKCNKIEYILYNLYDKINNKTIKNKMVNLLLKILKKMFEGINYDTKANYHNLNILSSPGQHLKIGVKVCS